MNTKEFDWIFPEGEDVKGMTGRIRNPANKQRRFRCGFDNDLGSHHNRLVDYAPNEYELIYILKGKGVYKDETGASYEFSDNTILQRFPNRVHTLEYQPAEQKVITCYIVVPAEVLTTLKMCGAIASSKPIIQYEYDKIAIQKLKNIYIDLRDSGKLELPSVVGRMYDFIAYLHQNIIWSKSKHSERQMFKKCCDILSKNLEEKLHMPDVAASLKLNYKTFRRLFEKHSGMSPGKYRIEMRIERACDMISSGTSLKETAERLNYPDVYTFSKQFKKFTGTTPAKYHQQS